MFSLMKMSGKWYAMEISDIASYEENLQTHVDNGDIVCLCDSLEFFADENEIEVKDIEIVES